MFVSTLLAVWIIGWMLTVGFMCASKNFMLERLWWRLLQLTMMIVNWPFVLGAQLHRALPPQETTDC